ncbi:MAG: family 16 glycosylhydrolase [Prolixibacteraceae bacterium]
MRKTEKLLLFVLFISFITVSCNNEKKEKLVWSDEFNDIGSPDSTKWEVWEYNRRNNPNGPDGWWDKEDVYQDGEGNLVIRIRKVENRNDDNDAYDYSVGTISSKGKFEKAYGIYEIRCKLPAKSGWWVAFWMTQGDVWSLDNATTDGVEVDIMEGFGWNNSINHAFHWDGYGEDHKSIDHRIEVEGIHDGFHIYRLEWNPDEYIFFIDGKETWRTSVEGVCSSPGHIKVTGEISTEEWAIEERWANKPDPENYPDYFIIDYVRVYDLN